MEVSDVPDAFRWRLANDGKFSASSAYKLFFLGREFARGAEQIWSSWAPLEVNFFVWLALHNRLWTADRLARRQLQHPAACALVGLLVLT